MTKLTFKPQDEATKEVENPQPKKRKFPLFLIPIGLLIAVGAGSAWYFLSPHPVQPLQVSGRIEGYETDIGAKFAGRVDFVAVREGDKVKKGEVIVRLDDEQVRAQLRGATARLIATQQAQSQAQLQINVLESQIQEALLNKQQAKGNARGQVFQAEASVAASIAQLNQAQAQLQQAQAELKLAKVNRDRYAQLVAQGAVPKQQYDQAQTAYETALATVGAAEASVESFSKLVNSARGQLVQAQTTELNPDIRDLQVQGLRTQLAQARLKQEAAKADVANARAAQQEIESQIADLNIISPIDGVIVTRSVEPGAVVTTGKTLLTAIDPREVYLRGFVPEGNIGKVRIGQGAKVFLDSYPDQPLDGKVSAIDTEASFTPENIYFKEDRVKQVFGIKISIDNPDGFAKPGMPADAELKE